MNLKMEILIEISPRASPLKISPHTEGRPRGENLLLDMRHIFGGNILWEISSKIIEGKIWGDFKFGFRENDLWGISSKALPVKGTNCEGFQA